MRASTTLKSRVEFTGKGCKGVFLSIKIIKWLYTLSGSGTEHPNPRVTHEFSTIAECVFTLGAGARVSVCGPIKTSNIILFYYNNNNNDSKKINKNNGKKRMRNNNNCSERRRPTNPVVSRQTATSVKKSVYNRFVKYSGVGPKGLIGSINRSLHKF